MISRRRGQNIQLRGGVKLEQFAQSDPLKGPEASAVAIMEKLFCIL
jgi:hypothetical protein